MFGSSPFNGASAYSKIGIETGVIAANPHKLIVMLYEGAITSISNAIKHIKTGNIEAKGQSISKAISIIDSGLRASLDKKAGGEIAISLDLLYEYMSNRLFFANLNNHIEALTEVQNLLLDIKSSWEAITPTTVQAPELIHQPVDALSPRSVNYFEA